MSNGRLESYRAAQSPPRCVILLSDRRRGRRNTLLTNAFPKQEDYCEKGASAPGADEGKASTGIATDKDRSDVDDAALRSDGYGVGAISRSELRENASHVSFDGVL